MMRGKVVLDADAVYSDGVLKPAGQLPLRDKQRVRLTVETIDEPNRDREAAVARLKAGIASMRFFSEGPRLTATRTTHTVTL